jgi:CBS domain-containing protein
MLIAFFIFLGAEGETRGVLVKLAVGRLKVRDLMSSAVLSVPEEASVYDTGERMLRERRLAFAVTEAGHPVGLVTLESVQAVPPEQRERVETRQIAIATPPLSPDDDAGKALRLMTETRAPQLAVAENGQLVGMISRNDIIRGLKLSELEETQHARPSWPMRRGNLPV